MKIKTIYLFITMIFTNYFYVYCNTKIDIFSSPIIESIDSFDTNLIDWKIFLLDILTETCFFDEIISDSILMINIPKNNTNRTVQTIKIANTLIELITENTKKYNVVSMAQMYRAYRELEISSEEILNSYEFSIKMANYLNADYIVYSIIYENSKNLYLELQLILSKTNEIIRVISKLL